MAPERPPVTVATLGDRYRIETLLGQGGMGAVYRARDLRLDRDVAVKVLPPGVLDDEARARLLREARSAATLNHPAVVAVYDAGEADGSPFVVMELVEGGSLREVEPLPIAVVVDLGIQLGQALAHAHGHGIVHRDLKPENVLVRRDGDALTFKLADLGVALTHGHARVTQEGAIVGTAHYLAPEQVLGAEVDGRADLYALGVLLYERLAGRLPFIGDDPLAIISQHLHAPVVPPSTYRPDLPAALEHVVLRLLAKRPEDRYASADETVAALGAIELAAADGGAVLEPDVAGSVRMLEQLARGRLIGRRTEIARLRELWRSALEGHGHMALVTGEPGVGKTRLVHELQVAARLEGAWILQGGCYEYEATTPYLPIVEALRRWVHELPLDALRERLAGSEAELARLAPEIETRLGPLAPAPALPPAEERLRLFDHIARVLRGLAAGHGLLLVLDDLHWADHGTLALLHYLLRNLRDERLLVVGAYRDVELGRAHPLAAALVEWNRERLATRIALGRFTREETAALLASLFGQDEVAPDFVEAVHRETEGNPFFVEEVMKTLIEQGQIYRGGGEWQRAEVRELVIPQSVKAAIGRRLERLRPECVEMLHVASALGRVVDFRELHAVSGAAEDALLDAVDEACAAQLLRPEGAEAFKFTHDKIREVLIEELNPVRRRRLHLRIGETLERLHADAIDEHVQDVAYHFVEGGDLRRGLTYARRAAQAAERIYAHDDALEFYARARECAEVLELPEEVVAIDVAIAAVDFLRGAMNPAVDRLERVLAFASDPARRAAIKATIGGYCSYVSDPRGVPYLEEALRELDPATQTNALALALAMRARYHHYKLEHRKAIGLLEEARRLAEPLDDPATLDPIYSFTAGAFQHMGRFEESVAAARQCVAFGERKQDLTALANGYEFLAEDHAWMGKWEESRRYALLDQEIGGKTGSVPRIGWGRFSEGAAHEGRGELPQALTTYIDVMEKAAACGEVRLGGLAGCRRARVLADLGLLEEAAEIARATMESLEQLGQHHLLAEAHYSIAWLDAINGEWARAVERLEAAVAPLESSDNELHALLVGPFRSECLFEAGRVEDAGRLATSTLEAARRSRARWVEGTALRALGRVAAAEGRTEDAALHFDEAVEILDRTGTRLELARTLVHRGALREAAGDRTGARAAWERAREIFRSCSARRELAALELRFGSPTAAE